MTGPATRFVVATVCSGNICRSPTAEVILRARIDDADLTDRVDVVSGGIGGWHVGDPMDRRSAATLERAGYDATGSRAEQVDPTWLDRCDLLLAMDSSHHDDLVALAGHDPQRQARVRMFRELDPIEPGGDVPDPYYGGADGFEEVLAMVERTSARWADEIAGLLNDAGRAGEADEAPLR